ncbi:hypothetical protein HNQ07_004784 [Deinococcus metalli]|uniref:Uncharacterized protein n=1 Tax=Deinococcus metalli TaxID=1141878 RepID=A0A7W8KJD3_9DEIO|nr:hypothetical protein [Deinococcus metalli]MBB5379269.1 hypothetical protein [Deinococcus metalli]
MAIRTDDQLIDGSRAWTTPFEPQEGVSGSQGNVHARVECPQAENDMAQGTVPLAIQRQPLYASGASTLGDKPQHTDSGKTKPSDQIHQTGQFVNVQPGGDEMHLGAPPEREGSADGLHGQLEASTDACYLIVTLRN